jgi:hypothetical protein
VRVMRVILRAPSPSLRVEQPPKCALAPGSLRFFFGGGARPGNITRITRNHADLAANQPLKVRVIRNSILRTITRITGAFPQSGRRSSTRRESP